MLKLHHSSYHRLDMKTEPTKSVALQKTARAIQCGSGDNGGRGCRRCESGEAFRRLVNCATAWADGEDQLLALKGE
jgi:hypothetical protein